MPDLDGSAGAEEGDRQVQPKMGLSEHFRNLTNFRGREDRASFWPYVAVVLGIVMIAGALVTLPMIPRLIEATPRSADPALPVGFLAAYLATTLGLAVLLFAAAVVRRLHDRGKSGAWGILPLPFLIFGAVQSVRLFDSMVRGDQPDSTLLLTIAASNVLWWAALMALVVLLAGPGVPEPDRHGPAD